MPETPDRTDSLKVLHVYRTYFPDTQGGLEEAIRQICLNTSAEGVESRVFTLSPSPEPAELEFPEARVVRARLSFEIASCGFCFAGLRRFAEQVAWADLVHYHFPWPYADVMHWLYGRGTPSVVTYHSDIVRQKFLSLFYRPLMRRFLRSVDRVVATSPNYVATSDVLGRLRQQIDTVPIGLQPESYPQPRDLEAEVARVRQTYGSRFFLFVGVLRYYKGLHILLEALRGADYKVVIVGIGPEEQALREQAAALSLDNVVFTGYLPDRDKMALFEACQGVVFPSCLRSEAFGVTLLEGAMSGKPLISAEVGSGSSHINLDERTGLVVPPGNPEALRAAMDRLDADPEFARQLGEHARERFERHFTGATMGAHYAQIYREVLADHAARSATAKSAA